MAQKRNKLRWLAGARQTRPTLLSLLWPIDLLIQVKAPVASDLALTGQRPARPDGSDGKFDTASAASAAAKHQAASKTAIRTRTLGTGRMGSEANLYQFDHLPVIDYDAHPAYGRALPPPRLGTRLKALLYFARGLFLIGTRRIADLEHLPRPTDRAHKRRWIVRHLPMYFRLIVSQRLSRASAGSDFRPATSQGKRVLEVLERDGITGFSLGPDKINDIRNLLAPHFKALEQRLAQKAPDARKFDETRLWLAPEIHPELYKWFNQFAAEIGVIEAASAYLKRPVAIAHVVPQINDPTDNFWANHFKDVGVGDSPCDYCHIDATYNLLKFIVYVSDVGPNNGPFAYVRGSHRASRGFWDGMIRRANDYAGLSSTKPHFRELFYALPRWLRRKAAFGADLPSDNEYTQPILKDEWQITSKQGDAVLFDPFGIHRGGMVREGRRLVVTMNLAELPR
jgi:Phytanoyl-CoA dioxygenase (PhyH)